MADCTGILCDDGLARLRKGYADGDGNTIMLAGADKNLTSAYEPSGPFVTWVSDRFYRQGVFSPKERERILISVLSDGPALTLSIHIYWGLMEGLTTQEVAEILLMTSAYRGLPLYSNQVRVLQKTLQILADLDEQGSSAPGIAVGSLVQAYG